MSLNVKLYSKIEIFSEEYKDKNIEVFYIDNLYKVFKKNNEDIHLIYESYELEDIIYFLEEDC